MENNNKTELPTTPQEVRTDEEIQKRVLNDDRWEEMLLNKKYAVYQELKEFFKIKEITTEAGVFKLGEKVLHTDIMDGNLPVTLAYISDDFPKVRLEPEYSTGGIELEYWCYPKGLIKIS